MENLLINTDKIYDFKNIIIYTIKKEKEGYTKSDEKTKNVVLSWLKYPDNFKELINEYNSDLKNIGKFIDGILSGKINNKHDAEDKYIKKIKEDEDYLEKFKSINKDFLRLRNIFKKNKICNLWNFITITGKV